MKKVGCLILAAATALALAALPADAWAWGRPFHHVGARVFVGVGPVWPWWWAPPVRYVYPAPVVIQQSPPVYIQQEAPPAEQYWYYCENPRGYYPYVPQCPGGWLKVAPNP
jgi:hypothetical protein